MWREREPRKHQRERCRMKLRPWQRDFVGKKAWADRKRESCHCVCSCDDHQSASCACSRTWPMLKCSFTSLDTAPKTYQNSGLPKNIPSKKLSELINPLQSGGLNDEDAKAAWPSESERCHSNPPDPQAPKYPKDLQCDHSHKNKVHLYLNHTADMHLSKHFVSLSCSLKVIMRSK